MNLVQEQDEQVAADPEDNSIKETPPEFFRKVDALFNFDIDLCALRSNRKCTRYYGPDFVDVVGGECLAPDALAPALQWHGTCWLNPPYSRGQLELWLKKAVVETQAGRCRVVALLPVDTSTQWWQTYVIPWAAEIYYVPKRIRFVGTKGSPKFGSALVLYEARLADVFADLGKAAS